MCFCSLMLNSVPKHPARQRSKGGCVHMFLSRTVTGFLSWDLALHVGKVCCWFSSLFRGFPPGLPPSSQANSSEFKFLFSLFFRFWWVALLEYSKSAHNKDIKLEIWLTFSSKDSMPIRLTAVTLALSSFPMKLKKFQAEIITWKSCPHWKTSRFQ